MSELTFKLTTESMTNAWGVELFRIEAIVDIPSRGVKKGDKGGWLESETVSGGNAQVYGDAQVSGDARVSGNASLKAKAGFKAGWFVGVDDDATPKTLSLVNGSDGLWKNTYVLGDYEIEDLEETAQAEKNATINIGGKEYEVTEELTQALKNLKKVK